MISSLICLKIAWSAMRTLFSLCTSFSHSSLDGFVREGMIYSVCSVHRTPGLWRIFRIISMSGARPSFPHRALCVQHAASGIKHGHIDFLWDQAKLTPKEALQ